MDAVKLMPDASRTDDEFGEWVEARGWKRVNGFKEEYGYQLAWVDPHESTRPN